MQSRFVILIPLMQKKMARNEILKVETLIHCLVSRAITRSPLKREV